MTQPPVTSQRQTTVSTDAVMTFLQNSGSNLVLLLLGILPIIFIPLSYIPFSYTKTFLVIISVLVAVVFSALALLRSGVITMHMSVLVVCWWVIVATGALSGLFSGDMADSFVGDTLNAHTVLFNALLAAVVTFVTFQANSKKVIMRFYIALTASGVLLGMYHVLRLFFGPEFLSFGLFLSNTASPIGGWNDLGLFFGLSILLSLLALNQLPLTTPGKSLFAAVIVIALFMLTTVNFFSVWIVLALVSMVVLMYSLTRDRFTDSLSPQVTSSAPEVTSLLLTIFVFIVSFSFVIAGGPLGNFVTNVTGISYLEVKPSPSATLEIARPVYSENALLGVGPNKFVDAWRQHKNEAINNTIFWNTNFVNGSGFIPTQFVTHGALGVAVWILFLATLLYSGIRFFIRSSYADPVWHFIGIAAFIASLYLWGMSFVYTPGVTILLLAASFTGIFAATYAHVMPVSSYTFNVASNKRMAFILIGAVMLVVVIIASILYYSGRHYASVFTFSEAVNNITENTEITTVENKILRAFNLYQNDSYTRQLGQYQLAKLNTYLGMEDLTDMQQTDFQTAIETGFRAGNQAVSLDQTEPANWLLLASLYRTLAVIGVAEADTRAYEAIAEAKQHDPHNPVYDVTAAQLAVATEEYDEARRYIDAATQLKSNYTDALFLSAQIDIAEGNVQSAIETTQAITTLEPNNPARFYQLGVLQVAADNMNAARTALERAVSLDQNYANARYYLAMVYVSQEQPDLAQAQLERVLELNPGNEAVTSLLEQIESGEAIDVFNSDTAEADLLDEAESVTEDADTITANDSPDTELVTPVNNVSDEEEVNEDTTTNQDSESLNADTATTTNESAQ